MTYHYEGPGGTGDVVGPSSSTDNAIARFDGTDGKTIQSSNATIDDAGNLTANNFSGTSSGTNTGDVTLTTIGSAPNANAASLTGQQLRLQPASGSFGGVVTTLAQSFAGGKTLVPVALVDAATIATDAALGNIFDVTLAASRTLGAPTNPVNGQKCVWRFRQNGTGGWTLTLNAAFRVFSGIAVELNTTASKTSIMGAIYNSADSTWDVVAFVRET